MRRQGEVMRTAILCAGFLIVGAVAGSSVTGYFLDRFYKRNTATFFAGELASSALQAELIKLGEVAIVLDTLEKSFPAHVIAIRENDLLQESMMADTAMRATKSFYVCTRTPVPAEISNILEQVTLPEDYCEAQR